MYVKYVVKDNVAVLGAIQASSSTLDNIDGDRASLLRTHISHL